MVDAGQHLFITGNRCGHDALTRSTIAPHPDLVTPEMEAVAEDRDGAPDRYGTEEM